MLVNHEASPFTIIMRKKRVKRGLKCHHGPLFVCNSQRMLLILVEYDNFCVRHLTEWKMRRNLRRSFWFYSELSALVFAMDSSSDQESLHASCQCGSSSVGYENVVPMAGSEWIQVRTWMNTAARGLCFEQSISCMT